MHREFARGVCVGAVLMAIAVFIVRQRPQKGPWTGPSSSYSRAVAEAAARRDTQDGGQCSWEAPRVLEPEGNPLWEIFQAHKTGPVVRKWTPYFDVYHRYFQRFRGRKLNFLEIGIQSGGSIGIWQKYFGTGLTMYGMDINPYCKELFEDLPRVHIFIADQSDREMWRAFRKQMRRDKIFFDVILDDGGHKVNQQITTFEEVWPLLKAKGVYMCEDTSTSMDHVEPFDYKFVDKIERPGTRTEELYGGGWGKSDSWVGYAKQFADIVNGHYVNKTMHPEFDPLKRTRSMVSAAFYDQMVVLEKGRHDVSQAVRAGDIAIPVVARLKDGEVDVAMVRKFKKKLAESQQQQQRLL